LGGLRWLAPITIKVLEGIKGQSEEVMRFVVLALWLVASAAILPAATIVYSPTPGTDDTVPVNLLVTFDDSAVPGAIQGTVQLQPDAGEPNIGDIRAVYFNLINLPVGLSLANVRDSITGADVTDKGINTANLGGGSVINPLGPFSVGVEIGTSGIGGNDIQSTTFLINSPDLTLANFAAIGVRVTSIGLPGSSRSGSGKFGDPTPTPGDPGDPVIPEPSTYILLTSGVGIMALSRLRRAKA
jgi:hypothetical protein